MGNVLQICMSLKLWPCWTQIFPAFANSLDPDQLTSEEANWPGSVLFVIKYVWICIINLNQVIWLAEN